MYLGKHVKLLLQNNLMMEGIVQEWSNKKVALLALDGKSTSIIAHPRYDIRVIKLIHEEKSLQEPKDQITEKPVSSDLEDSKSELDKKFNQVKQSPSDNQLRIKTLAELKSELIEQEKIMIASRLKEHNIGEVKTVRYEQPRFFKK
jgi:hypothetical protein